MLKIINKFKIILLKLLLIIFIYTLLFGNKVFSENQKLVKIGILLGFTGTIESITPSMANAVELAFNEIINESEEI